MAKGFTVKAKAPTVNKNVDEFDLAAAKEMIKNARQWYSVYLDEDVHIRL